MTGTGAFGSAVLSSGKRPSDVYCETCMAPGPVVEGSVPPKPLDRTTIDWCMGTLTPSPTLPRPLKASVAAVLMIVRRERFRPWLWYVSVTEVMKLRACDFFADDSHLESCTTCRSLKNMTLTMSFGP